MAGRKPKPTQLKLVTGNPGKRPLSQNEPKPQAADLSTPPDLSDEAKKHWSVVAMQLSEARVLSELDIHALALYCEAYARWHHANEQIKKYGPVVKAPSGFPVQSPFLAIANKAFDQMKAMLIEFGMTPSSRTRVQTIGEYTSGSPWDDL